MYFLLQMLNRLTKSAEVQTRVDEDYFNINMEGHQMRLKWENTLKNCHQVRKDAFLLFNIRGDCPEWLEIRLISGAESFTVLFAACIQILQELEKQRIEVVCNILTRYNLHMSSFGQTLKHVRDCDITPAHE